MSFERVSRRLRRRVAERAHWRCEYCRTPAAFSTEALLMNRPELVNLRRILHLNGEHPP
jgi:hypothetical protein